MVKLLTAPKIATIDLPEALGKLGTINQTNLGENERCSV